MITYKKGSLFEALKTSDRTVVLTHACNCKGVWGSGIAVDFKERYPEVFAEYATLCAEKGDLLLGSFSEHKAKNGDTILCLYTSRNYGNAVDTPEMIIDSTELALRKYMASHADPNIHMPKINSGRFRVSWSLTEGVLERYLYLSKLAESNLRITVWEP